MQDSGIFIHQTAIVESDSIGAGTKVWAFAHIMDGAVVGSSCKIGDHVFIESGAVVGDRVTVKNNSLIWHGVHIGDDVFVGPNVVFTNDMQPRAPRLSRPEDWIPTHIEAGASIGANATVICGTRLGRWCMIGAGSVVTRDVPPFAVVVGNPARFHGWVCQCGSMLDDSLECQECGRMYQQDRDGLTALSDKNLLS